MTGSRFASSGQNRMTEYGNVKPAACPYMAVNLPNKASIGTCIVDFILNIKARQIMEKLQNEIGECSSNSQLDSATETKQSEVIETQECVETCEINMHQQQQLHRGIKRDIEELQAHSSSSDHEDMEDTKIGLKPGKKTRGRVKIKMEYIDNKLRRYTTFSKRKTGIMKKAYELSTLTGTQVMLLVASETGHVYTFATRKLQPMITSESGKALIQTCLNSPDPNVNTVALDQRMSATGYEEPDLSYSSHDGVNVDKDGKASIFLNQNIDLNQTGTGSMTGITLQSAGNGSFPMTTYLPPSTTQQMNVSKSGGGVQSLSVQAMPGGAFATIFTPGATFPNGTYQLGQGTQQPLTQVVNPQLHLQRMQAATTSANSHMDNNLTVASHNHHHASPEHPAGDSPPNAGHMSGVPINVLSMQGSESGQNNAVYTSGNMPLMYNSSGILYATPPTTQSSVMSDGDSSGSHHLVMQDGTVVTSQGIPVSLQHVPGALQVHQEYGNSLQHHSNGIHDNHNSPGDIVGMVDPSSLSVHPDGALEKNMNSHK